MTCGEVTVQLPRQARRPRRRRRGEGQQVYTTVTPLGGILTFLSLGTWPGTLTMSSCFDARLESGPTVQTNVTVGTGCP